MTWYRHAYCFQKHVYQVSFENVESYEVRLKFWDDADTDDNNDAKGIKIP